MLLMKLHRYKVDQNSCLHYIHKKMSKNDDIFILRDVKNYNRNR
jgi:hypothetical protein